MSPPLLQATGIFAKLIFWAGFLLSRFFQADHIPGPIIARYSRLWLVKVLASGDSARVFEHTNKQYGNLARIGPNHILTDDPSTIRRILTRGSGYTRGPWFDALRLDPHSTNIVSERSERKHNELRHRLASAYSGKGIDGSEHVIDFYINRWLRCIHRSCTAGHSSLFDIGSQIQFLTLDIVSELSLGKCFGCLEHGEDRHGIIDSVEKGMQASLQMSVLHELFRILYYITKVPLLHRLLVPSTNDKTGFGRALNAIEKAIESRVERGMVGRRDMLGMFLEKSLPRKQVREELMISLVAGYETTATSIQGTLLAIISNPRVYTRLAKEIDNAIASGRVSSPVKDAEAHSLPYFQACILEGLRIHPPVGQLRERQVPPEGDVILGFRVPGGTFVGLNSWGAQSNHVYGNDAEIFRPERWLTSDIQQLQAMKRAHDLIFGHGPTKCLGATLAKTMLSKAIFEVFRYFDVAAANPAQPWTSVCWGVFFQKNFRVTASYRDGTKQVEELDILRM